MPDTETKNSNLLPCPDCGKLVSKHAISCPNCGHPFSTQTACAKSEEKEIVTIEKTSKTYKKKILIGSFLVTLGMILFAAGFLIKGDQGIGLGIFGVLFFILGLFIYGFARLGAWWHNG